MGIKISMQREVKERIRKEIIEAAQQYAEEYEIENYTDTASALNCVYAEFKNQFDWKIKQIGEYNAFIEWLRGLPMSFVYSYYDERMTIQKWFNQSDEEASKYSDDQVDKLYWNLLAREFFALVKKFNVSGIPEPQSESTKPYDMDDYLDNDNALEENISVSDVLSEKLTGVQTERHRTITVPRKYTQENDNLELTYTRGPDGEYWATIYRRLSNNDIEFETQLNKKFSTFAEFKSNVINMIEEYNNKFKLTDNNDMNDYLDNDNALEESTALVSDYNGWTNYDTWNVMMWINNDYGIYKEAVHFMNKYFKNDPYKDFIIYCGLENDKTPDKVEWISDKLNYNELNDAMREFVESTAEEELIEEEDLDFLRKYD